MNFEIEVLTVGGVEQDTKGSQIVAKSTPRECYLSAGFHYPLAPEPRKDDALPLLVDTLSLFLEPKNRAFLSDT